MCSQKRKEKHSYVYVLDKEVGSRHYWRYEKQREYDARLITDLLVEGIHKIISKTVTHASHAPGI
ncbi:unnamed protein product [Ixodes persulcatus]